MNRSWPTRPGLGKVIPKSEGQACGLALDLASEDCTFHQDIDFCFHLSRRLQGGSWLPSSALGQPISSQPPWEGLGACDWLLPCCLISVAEPSRAPSCPLPPSLGKSRGPSQCRRCQAACSGGGSLPPRQTSHLGPHPLCHPHKEPQRTSLGLRDSKTETAKT